MPVSIQDWSWLRKRPTDTVQRLAILGTIFVVGVLGSGVMILLDARTDAWHRAEQSSNRQVLALTREMTRNFTRYDHAIQGVRDAIVRPDIGSISLELRQMLLFDRATGAEDLDALLVLGESGDIIAESSAIEPNKVNFVDTDFFQIHQQRSDAGLFIGRAHPSRIEGGDANLPISRRISHPDGTFGGVVVGFLRLACFGHLLETLDLGTKGSVTLFRSDGRVVMRLPYREAEIDQDLGDTEAIRILARSEAGSLVRTVTADDVERLYAFRHLPGLPLVLSHAIAVDDVYAAWWRNAPGIGTVMGLLSGVAVTGLMWCRRENLCRRVAESRLRDAAEELVLNATTDTLTGLASRRTFEERLMQEWLRSIRANTPIALLMLDADHFDRFEAERSQSEDDQVLRSVAACIANSVMRPGDVPACYGGKAFIVLLSETELPGALVVAERIRAAVGKLVIPSGEYSGDPLTVSIGVATASPVTGDAPLSLVNLADTALQNAKYAGRNQISATGNTVRCSQTESQTKVPLTFIAADNQAASQVRVRSRGL